MMAPKNYLSVPGNDRFDVFLRKVWLDRRTLRNVLLEFLGMLVFTFFGGIAVGSAAPWVNGLLLASIIYATDGGELS